MRGVVIALAIVLGVVIIQAAISVPLLRSWKRKESQFWRELDAQVATGGERVVIPREPANYGGATAVYGKVKGLGSVILTDRRLVFRKLSTGVVEVPRAKLTGARIESSFRGTRMRGRSVVVMSTTDPAELGVLVSDPHKWTAAINADR